MKQSAIEGMLGLWVEQLFYSDAFRRGRKGEGTRPGACESTSKIALRSKLRALVFKAPEVMVRVNGGGRGMAPIRAHMAYISRGGTLALEDEHGEGILGREALADLAEEWRFARSEIPSRSERREALNVILSMPSGTNASVLLAAAREFAQEEFTGHKFAMVLHEPQTDARSLQPHVHLIVRKQGEDGRRLSPGRSDLTRWRQRFADRLVAHGIAASATRRQTRGELQARKSPMEQRLQRVERKAWGLRPSERAAATEIEVLRAWYGIAEVLSHSEDLEDRDLAREALEFVGKMPMVARRRALLHRRDRVAPSMAPEPLSAARDQRNDLAAARHREPEWTR